LNTDRRSNVLSQIQDLILPDSSPIRVSLEPAVNGLHSLWLLIDAETKPGLDAWVTDTVAALTTEERERHKLVLVGLYCAILPEQSWVSFPAYLDHLATCDPVGLRDKMLKLYTGFFQSLSGREHEQIDWEAILETADTYLGFLRERLDADYVDEDIEAQAYAYIVEPSKMQDLVVSHLREMWEQYLAPEWERVSPMLQDAVTAFEQVDCRDMERLEAAQRIIGQSLEVQPWYHELEQADHVVFVPTTHVGPYLGKFWGGHTVWVFFGARLPDGVEFDAPDLSRTDIMMRMLALTDDCRLRILRLIAEKGELCSQDIIEELDLSQSTASRHLKQLSATGYLTERRRNSAKCYALNPERIKGTLQAVSVFLLGEALS
jgi:DNA-binding transcriptional ArsR family regulator